MSIPNTILALCLTLTSLTFAQVPPEEGMVYIPGKGNSPDPEIGNVLREGSNGYLTFTLEYTNCVARGADFLGLESGVGIGIRGINPEMRKDLFQLDQSGDRKIYFFNRSKSSKLPNRIKDQPMHLGYVPIKGIQTFQFEPLIFLADDPKGDKENELNKILDGATTIGNMAGISEVGSVVKIVTFASNTLIDIFNLKDDRFLLKEATPPLAILKKTETEPNAGTLRTGRYLIFSRDFSKQFNKRSIKKRFGITDDWRVEDANWSVNSSRQLCLPQGAIQTEAAFMIIKIEWTDTIFVEGETNLRLADPPAHWGKDSALQNSVSANEKAIAALDGISSYSPGSVWGALKEASDAYDSLLLNLKAVKYLDRGDTDSLVKLTKNRIVDKTLTFISKSSGESMFGIEEMKADWRELFKRRLFVDSFAMLPQEPKTEAKGLWLIRAREILDTKPAKP